ncbi:ATP synthase F1 subunit gamma [Caloramator australicus]|uniref:ATP synthase gamma chain n=1 Tax=Caloramator australicus RC3 TaxID=857293 RepID=G0V4I2_9CLOT|nr:ATP synthase F1 subunit gamma [Caloramator australicus]CCC58022.1 ATP synthase gamma chain [Caloramator australicus RC3]
MSKGELIEIKRRIKSIKNTQKITKAMGLVATARFKRLRGIVEFADEYFNEVSNTFRKLYCDEVYDSKYFSENNENKDLFIIITSNTGLCGSYNSNIINFANEKVAKEDYLILIGDRGYQFFKRREYNVLMNIPIQRFPSFDDAQMIFNLIDDYFTKGKVKNIYIVYTKFINSVRQEVEMLKILPFEKIQEKNKEILLEPNKLQVFDFSAKIYLQSFIYNSLANALASEFAMRMTAMDSATKNSGELLDKLQLKYNRIRQGTITQEVTEIVSGAEALNSN